MIEPQHYLRFCADKELTQEQVRDVADVIYDHLEDSVTDSEVIMHINDLGQYCYIFALDQDIVTADDGTFIGDAISDDLMDALPDDLEWALEASLPDQVVDVPDTATEQEIHEAAVAKIRTLLKG